MYIQTCIYIYMYAYIYIYIYMYTCMSLHASASARPPLSSASESVEHVNLPSLQSISYTDIS